MADKKPVAKITQKELEELVALDDQAMSLAELIRDKRADIEARLLEGGVVEEGPCYAIIDRGYKKQGLSKAFLVEVLGDKRADEIWNKLDNKPYEKLDYGRSAAKTAAMLGKLKGEKGGKA